MGKKRNEYRVLVEKPKERNHFEGLSIGGKEILKLILNKLGG
jgi:hypothetical protein